MATRTAVASAMQAAEGRARPGRKPRHSRRKHGLRRGGGPLSVSTPHEHPSDGPRGGPATCAVGRHVPRHAGRRISRHTSSSTRTGMASPPIMITGGGGGNEVPPRKRGTGAGPFVAGLRSGAKGAAPIVDRTIGDDVAVLRLPQPSERRVRRRDRRCRGTPLEMSRTASRSRRPDRGHRTVRVKTCHVGRMKVCSAGVQRQVQPHPRSGSAGHGGPRRQRLHDTLT